MDLDDEKKKKHYIAEKKQVKEKSKEEKDYVKQILKEEMMGACPLAVPLEIDIQEVLISDTKITFYYKGNIIKEVIYE